MLKKCSFCGKEIEKNSNNKSKNSFCNLQCRGKWQSENFKGENNPNYNKKWNEEQRERTSEIMKAQMQDPQRRYISGNANRGKKFSEERCKNISEGHKGLKGTVHSIESKEKIGKSSKEKFKDPEYIKKNRETREKSGQWVPLNQKSDYDIYYIEANWKCKMFDLITDKNQLKLLKELGIFNNKENSKGAVRDHKYSRKSGFNEKVFPQLLRHPCNLEILTHSQNISKKQSKNINDDSITLEQLFNLIQNYIGYWDEQELCLQLIQKYQNRERWERIYE